MSAAGEVRVERSLYRAKPGEKTICLLEMQAGIVDGYWTPLAARQGVWVTASNSKCSYPYELKGLNSYDNTKKMPVSPQK